MKPSLPPAEEPDLPIASLIDMTFLLLVYFICTCSLIQPEGDLGIRLPGRQPTTETLDVNDEQIIEVRQTGRVIHNGSEYDTPDSQDLPGLTTLLMRYKLSCEANNNPPMITILAEDEASHQRVIDVMNACAAAKIKNVTFGSGAAE